MPDHQVIVDAELQETGALDELPRQTDILAARCGITGYAELCIAGDPAPSREDMRLTRQLVDAAQLVDLKIHDHVIVGNGSGAWVSFATRGLM